ncbi:hypothetical protein ABMA27_003466 [Loxostege sticticalis]|uniref:RNA-directed DNA polymerase n=1 Tax=Loxostege sticticalis TaxID=481309 RepID=A0ABR3HTC5_LOXSC
MKSCITLVMEIHTALAAFLHSFVFAYCTISPNLTGEDQMLSTMSPYTDSSEKSCFRDTCYSSIETVKNVIQKQEEPLIIYTDHKPLTYAVPESQSSTETPRRTRQLSFISEFTTDIRHVSGKDNIVADALSRIETISTPSPINYEEFARTQQKDSELQRLQLQDNITLKKVVIPNTDVELYCEISTSHIRPYIPEEHRYDAFKSVHNISHPGTRTTRKLTSQKYFWPSMNADIGKWTKTCIDCQKSKIQRHTFSGISKFPPTDRFQHVHIDIVGPLPNTSQGPCSMPYL